MEKVLLVINAHQPDIASIEFGCRIAHLLKTKLTGLFVETYEEEYMVVLNANNLHSALTDMRSNVVLVKAETEEAIQLFKNECHLKGVPSEVYIDKGDPVQEVLYECRYADLLLVDPGVSYFEKEEQTPSQFVKEILAKAECPVLLTPDNFDEVEEIVFCYDGSASAVYAMKQFTYLLPAFKDKNVLLLEVNETGNAEFNDNHKRMMQWLRTHYHSAYYHALNGKAKDELFIYLFSRNRRIVIMGAYGRSLLSQFFRRSSADRLIRMVDLPLFITHY